MNCQFCGGTGDDESVGPCFYCNGSGNLCDECGKPTGYEDGLIHRECLAILRADRRRDEAKDEA